MILPRWLIVGFFVAAVPAAGADETAKKREEHFERSVRPVLLTVCAECHGAKKQEGGLRVDSLTGLQKGGDQGSALTAGKPSESLLIKAIRRQDGLEMPPTKPLTAEQVAALTQWVADGAVWPASAPAATPMAPASKEGIAKARQQHWAYQPIGRPTPPAVRDGASGQNPIDRFVLARLEKEGLRFAPLAERSTLLRRLALDLIGLPPTYEAQSALRDDPSPAAVIGWIDRWLSTPAFGERWARHWLDLSRYSDTTGYQAGGVDMNYYSAYAYRDYVIRAFNQDKPFDRFVTEQLAADQLGLADHDPDLAAGGFITLGRKFEEREMIDDRIDVIARGLLGMTLGCARCHDHKFDALPAADYYAFFGILKSSVDPKASDQPLIGPLDVVRAFQAYETELKVFTAAREQHVNDTRERLEKAGEFVSKRSTEKEIFKKATPEEKERLKELDQQIEEKKKQAPIEPPRALLLRDGRPYDPVVFLRGQPDRRGPATQRRFLEVASPTAPPKPFTKGSGRLELAQEIMHPDNPLTARVIVNRLWQHYFGAGLVRTPSDFGVRGEPPTHPELLDYLARYLIDHDWSLKAVHRLIVTSRTYQQSSQHDANAWGKDPENRLCWRMNRRKLDFEPLRDAVLACNSQLDLTMAGKSIELFKPPFSTRRSVYAKIDRQELASTLRTFDFSSPDASTAARPVTIVPQQSLFLMNSPWIAEQSEQLARKVCAEFKSPTDWQRVIYQRVLSRDPGPDETQWADTFLAAAPSQEHPSPIALLVQALFLSNEFSFVD